MLSFLIASALFLAPSDTFDCGTYDAQYTLDSRIAPVLTGADEGFANIRLSLGLTQQPDSAQRAVVQDTAICEPLVQYFVSNMDELADEAVLNEYGWRHGVMMLGPYRILLVVPRNPPGQILGHGSYLLFFDDEGQFISSSIL